EDGVVLGLELGPGHVDADIGRRDELDAFGLHDGQAAIDDLLLELEVGDPVAQQAADAIVSLVQRNLVARTAQLLCRGQPRRTRADDGDAAPGRLLGRADLHPTFFERAFDDLALDLLDRDGVVVDRQDAGALARRGAEATGELGEVVGRLEREMGLVPTIAVHEIVPIRDAIPERAALLAERNAAIHAASALRPRLLLGPFEIDLVPVEDAKFRGAARGRLATPLL